MRRPHATVSVLEVDGESDRISNTVSAPGRAHARLYRPQTLAVGLTTLETSGDEATPDVGKVLLLSAEEVDTLTTV